MNSSPDSFRFIVIGGGICGCQIAALLAREGKVLLLEATSNLGGRAIVKDIQGFKFDFGPHPIRFGPKSALATTLRDIGKEIKFIKPGLMYCYLADGTRHIFPSGIKGFLKSKLVPISQVISFLWRVKMMLKSNFRNALEMSLSIFAQFYKISPKLYRFLLMASSSMQVNPFPERTSIGEMGINFIEVLKKKSVFYPEGGWNAIFTALCEKIKQNGEIRTNSKVDRIIIKDKMAVGVEIGDQKIYADYVISTIPVQQLETIIDTNLIPIDFAQKIKNLHPTSGICWDIGLSKKITDETLMFFENPLAFGICTTNFDPNLASNGKSILSFFMPCDSKNFSDKIARETVFKELKTMIMNVYPRLQESIEIERPLFLNMVDGVEININQHRLCRPDPIEIGLANFFLTGDSIGGTGTGGDIGHTSVRECYYNIKKQLK